MNTDDLIKRANQAETALVNNGLLSPYGHLIAKLRDAIEALQTGLDAMREEKQMEFDIASGYHKKWQDAGLKIESMRDENRWIPVTERLPEKNKFVLVLLKFTEKIEVGTDMYIEANGDKGWVRHSDRFITHWRPLPKAPEDGV